MKVLFPDPFSSPDFSDDEITEAVHLLTHGDVSDDSKGNFLSALHHRGETASELAGFARAILKESIKVRIEHRPAEPLLELCGTGGDRAGYLNISTAAMFVAAGAGARVVKHGNRAVSSRCGSADVLESLGVSLHLRPDSVGRILENAGSVFLLASDFHPSISVIAPLRRVLARNGQMTIFNLLGPLLNPALPEFQLTGIFKPELLDFYAQALGMMGRRKAWAVHGKGLDDSEGVDELSITGPSRVFSSSREGEGEREGSPPPPTYLPSLPPATQTSCTLLTHSVVTTRIYVWV